VEAAPSEKGTGKTAFYPEPGKPLQDDAAMSGKIYGGGHPGEREKCLDKRGWIQ
jgi:hypothetical protein